MDSHIRTPVIAIQAAVAGAAQQTPARFAQCLLNRKPLDDLGE
jgi:hypothetical protein